LKSAIIGLLGVIVGTLITGVAQLVNTQLINFRTRKSLAAAFAAEISSLVESANRRKYLQDIQRLLSEINLLPDDAPFSLKSIYTARVKQEYFTVFAKNSDRLGLVNPAADDIVTFYTFARSVLGWLFHLEPCFLHSPSRFLSSLSERAGLSL